MNYDSTSNTYHVGGGKHMTVRQMCEVTGFKRCTIEARIRSGVLGEALLAPLCARNQRGKAGGQVMVRARELVVAGKSNREIVAQLGCTIGTAQKARRDVVRGLR